MLAWLCCAAVRRMPGSFGRSPLAASSSRSEDRAGNPQPNLLADRDRLTIQSSRRSLADPAGRDDDVRPQTPHLEASLRIERPQAFDRCRGEHVHDGKIEERPGWQGRRRLPSSEARVRTSGFRPAHFGRRTAGIVAASGTLILREAACEEPIQGETGRWRH
jgi:hypothetical protein